MQEEFNFWYRNKTLNGVLTKLKETTEEIHIAEFSRFHMFLSGSEVFWRWL